MQTEELYRIWSKLQTNFKPRTRARYAEIFELRILPRFGARYAEGITAAEIGEWLTNLAESGNLRNGKGLACASVKQIVSAFRALIVFGMRTHLIGRNPFAGITVQNSHEKKTEVFTSSEQRKIEQYILRTKKPKLYGILIALYTGLRIGELLALSWADVDLRNRTMDVNKTSVTVKTEGKCTVLFCPPKSESGKRIVPFARPLLPLLKEMKAAGGRYLLSGKGGAPLSVRSYQASFAAVLARLDVRHRGFHSLRHTFATRALACGADIRTLAEILGHSDPSLTLKRYAHSDMEVKNRLIEKIGRNISFI